MRRYPSRFVSVVLVDHTRPDAQQELERWVNDGASGVRLPPGARSPGDDPYAIWRAAARLGVAVSCLGYAVDYAAEDFSQLVQSVPRARIVVEHLGVTGATAPTPADAAIRRRVLELARFPNVAMKVPGLGEFARRRLPVQGSFPFEEPIPPYLDDAVAAFGAERLMWGSDFPPVAAREGYGNALRLCQQYPANRSDAEQALIFGGTATRFFPQRR
jgi:L-fuconolactonase